MGSDLHLLVDLIGQFVGVMLDLIVHVQDGLGRVRFVRY